MKIKLTQYNMKKTFAILSFICGLFFVGCSEFELVELEDPKLEALFETYQIESPEIADYLFNDILLAPYFLQSDKGYFGSYDLRLQVYAKSKGMGVEVVGASIPQLDMETALEVNIKSEYFSDKSGLFINHKALISEISGTDLYEAGSEGRTVDVTITAQGEMKPKFSSTLFQQKRAKSQFQFIELFIL